MEERKLPNRVNALSSHPSDSNPVHFERSPPDGNPWRKLPYVRDQPQGVAALIEEPECHL